MAHRPAGGFTLIEMLIALAIAAVLGVALMAALSAGLRAYATSTEMSGAQTSARLVMQRAMAMIRTSSLHDAYDPDDGTLTLIQPGTPLRTVGIEMQLPDQRVVRLWWAVNDAYGNADLGDLWYEQVGQEPQPVIERVWCRRDAADEPFIFTLTSRESDAGLLLARATLDLTLGRDPAATTDLEQAAAAVGELRLVGSAMPRKNLD